MDQQFQTSFIPRKPSQPMQPSVPISMPRTSVAPQMPPPRTVSVGGSVLSLLTGIFFIGTLLSAIGVYAYNLTLTKNINAMSEMIKSAKKGYQEDLIATFESTDKRFKSAAEVFNNHIIVSPIFDSLQELTLKTISFNSFSYDFGKDGNILVKLSGRAINYEAIALQSDTLSTNRFIKDPVFSNLDLDEDGKVVFDLEFLVDKAFINYVGSVDRDTNIRNETNDKMPGTDILLENTESNPGTQLEPTEN